MRSRRFRKQTFSETDNMGRRTLWEADMLGNILNEPEPKNHSYLVSFMSGSPMLLNLLTKLTEVNI